MKLYGKELDDELARRKTIKNKRIVNRISFREEAKKQEVKPVEYLSWEYGYDICPHEKFKDSVGGFPVPLFIMKVCEKCGYTETSTMEKVNEGNMERVYNVYKDVYETKESEFPSKK